MIRKFEKHIIKVDEKKVYKGFESLYHTFFGLTKRYMINEKVLLQRGEKIYNLSLQYQANNIDELKNKIKLYKEKIIFKKITTKEEDELFAIVVEIGHRVINKRAFSVQIMGALAMYQGYVIQMQTGEGKTLTATISAIIYAMSNKNIHIFTSNDYLAKRDAVMMYEYYKECGVSVGYVIGGMQQHERKENYTKNVVYSTSKEILADYLKDRMNEEDEYDINKYLLYKMANKDYPKDYFLNGLDIAIIDEADSVLADEAITPLIISKQIENKILKSATVQAYEISKLLIKNKHYKVYEKHHQIIINDLGKEVIQDACINLKDIWQIEARREFLINQALLARELYHLNQDYIIKDDKLIIVDKKTGRVMKDRKWGNGLHQAVEIKESIPQTDPTAIFARLSFQRFFRYYTNICGMSGTLHYIKNELWSIYNLHTITIPTRLKSKLVIEKEKIYKTKKEKMANLVEYIKSMQDTARPILIGMQNIDETQRLNEELKKINIDSLLLNAKNDEEEAQIIHQAGQKYQITIATNMAGRGTDIYISDEIDNIGGLLVITTQKDKSIRVDRQFFGRCARWGQNGSAISFVSLEDEIMEYYIPKWLKNILIRYFDTKYGKNISIAVYNMYQYILEKKLSKIRKKSLFLDFEMEENISFIKSKL